MKKWLITLLVFFYGISLVEAKDFTATVNRNPVPEGEAVVLTLELTDVDTTESPDLAALSNDFTIVSVSNGYRTNIINGDVSKSRQWNLVMIPNHGGEITIPEIELAGFKTKPVVLHVRDAGKIADNAAATTISNAPNFKMSGTVDNKNPYVQQQINYKLKIYDAGGLQGDAPIFLTGNDDWIIKNLSEPKVATQIINGKSMREITFEYALFPQKSGKLQVPAVRFNGYYLTKSKRIDPFADFFDDSEFFESFGLNDIFARKNPVVLSTKPINIEVKPAAVDNGWWLPASKVEMSAEFEESSPRFKVGEPITRTIHLKAYGVSDNQLPELKFSNVEGIKQYPEKPISETSIQNGQIVALMQVNNVYIPSQSGEVVLPEIKVNWFNTLTNSPETTTIPAYKAYVSGDANNTQAQPKQQAAAQQQQATAAPAIIVNQADNDMIIWMLLGAFAGGMVITFLLFKLFGKTSEKATNHYHEVIEAARNSDIHKLRDELLWWGQAKFPGAGISNLQDLADILHDEDFNLQLDKIREALYGGSEIKWDGVGFVSIFKKAAAHKRRCDKNEEEILPKLYK